MTESEYIKGTDERLVRIVAGSLRAARGSTASDASLHLDDDTLSALCEGALTKRESSAAVAHLAECSYCRHISAELVRLAAETEPIETGIERVGEGSTGLAGSLSSWFAGLFSNSGAEVFAHQDDEPHVTNDDVQGHPQDRSSLEDKNDAKDD